MTLIAALKLSEGGTWMGGERIVGSEGHVLAGPKIFQLTASTTLDDVDGQPYLMGFAGSPRVAQSIIAVLPPPWQPHERSLHAWLTDYCDRIRRRCQDELLIQDTPDGGFLVGNSCALVAIDGHLVQIGCDLSWEELALSYRATGVAFETWSGAYVAHLEHLGDELAAARAWLVAQAMHGVGSLVDELIIG